MRAAAWAAGESQPGPGASDIRSAKLPPVQRVPAGQQPPFRVGGKPLVAEDRAAPRRGPLKSVWRVHRQRVYRSSGAISGSCLRPPRRASSRPLSGDVIGPVSGDAFAALGGHGPAVADSDDPVGDGRQQCFIVTHQGDRHPRLAR